MSYANPGMCWALLPAVISTMLPLTDSSYAHLATVSSHCALSLPCQKMPCQQHKGSCQMCMTALKQLRLWYSMHAGGIPDRGRPQGSSDPRPAHR